MSVKKYRNQSWDFKAVNTKEYTHCYHNYPAMMIPQIARKLINLYGKQATTLFDPYCGTGTSLVEASLVGIDACGTDLNPLARLIATTKTSVIELQLLDLYLKEFNDFLFSLNFGINNIDIIIPSFKNIDFWFNADVKVKLASIKQFINNIKNAHVKKFFLVAFSETVRESSLTRNNEFKLHRIPQKQREHFSPDVFGLINQKLARNRLGLKSYLDAKKNKAKVNIGDFSSVAKIKKIAAESIDLVVTSPPYGDSRTTVAYGQFSRLSNQWLDIDNAQLIDNTLMGGKAKPITKTGSVSV